MKKSEKNLNVPNKRLEPNLRFPGFEGEWVEKKLKTVMIEGKLGGNYENAESNNGLPVIKMGNLDRGEIKLDKIQYLLGSDAYSNDDILKDGDLLFNTRNTLDLVGKVAIWRNELPLALYNSNLMRIKFNHLFESSNRFLNALFNTKKAINQFKAFATGTTSVAAIYGRDLANFELTFPLLDEQQKIASFLNLLHTRISTQIKIIEGLQLLKSSISKKIFSQQLRFKDGMGNEFPDWQVKSLGNCLDYFQPTNYLVSSTEYNESYKTPVVTAGKTFILGFTDEDYGIFKDLPVIIFDDFTTSTQFVNFPFKAKSSAMKILVAKENVSIRFMYERMQNLEYEIGGHERHWISKFSPLQVLIPLLAEQNRIANFLSSIDSKIAAEKIILAQYQNQKKYLLQNLFV